MALIIISSSNKYSYKLVNFKLNNELKAILKTKIN